MICVLIHYSMGVSPRVICGFDSDWQAMEFVSQNFDITPEYTRKGKPRLDHPLRPIASPKNMGTDTVQGAWMIEYVTITEAEEISKGLWK